MKAFLELFKPLHLFFIAWGLVAFGAVMNASMDTIDHHYSRSIFKNMGCYFAQDWTAKYEKGEDGKLIYGEDNKPIRRKWFGLIPIHPMFFDFWHLAKVLMLGSLLGAGLFAQRRLKINIKTIIFYIVFGWVSWIIVFNLFYDTILLN